METTDTIEVCHHCKQSKSTKEGGACASNDAFVCLDCAPNYCFICALGDCEVETNEGEYICSSCFSSLADDDYDRD